MFNFLPTPILGVITALLFSVNTLIMTAILYLFALIKFIIPSDVIRERCSQIIIGISNTWIAINSFILELTQEVHWDIEGLEGFDPKRSYLVISNHTSWTDIFVLQHIFRNKAPFLKFFLKQELIYVPFLGLAWWALDFPFLKRYSPKKIAKKPQLAGKDFETTRKQCEKFKASPVSVMNFVEGTRFTQQKFIAQHSPYQHLLKPKIGGVAVVLSTMGGYLDEVIDVTLYYPGTQAPVTFWDLLSGKMSSFCVHIRRLPLPKNTDGRDYVNDSNYRHEIREWLNQIWAFKDQLLESYKMRSIFTHNHCLNDDQKTTSIGRSEISNS